MKHKNPLHGLPGRNVSFSATEHAEPYWTRGKQSDADRLIAEAARAEANVLFLAYATLGTRPIREDS